jgi:sugar O-acyltransferase (sialic acid O-acetyltransferase NeuD family)
LTTIGTGQAPGDIVVIGGGGHAKVLISVLKKLRYAVRGYTDRENRGYILGVPYLGKDVVLGEVLEKCTTAVVGMGKIDTSPARLGMQIELVALGFHFPAICSPHSVVNDEVSLGAGTAVFDGAVISSGAQIGRACIINTSSTVEHDCRIGDNVHVAPGATLGGGVSLGDNCMIGTGTNVIQSISICANCLIGAGATVIRDVSVPGTYAGNPARKIR